MNLFRILRDHAQRVPEDVATSSSRHRLTTWRKLWSRVERASARLQGEWLVESGDVVMYCGNGHPDALILWLALARIGAVLLPLETAELRQRASTIADRHGVRLLLYDDGIVAPLQDDFCACKPLSLLISRRCDHVANGCRESVQEPSLIVSLTGAGNEAHGQETRSFNLLELMDQSGAPVDWPDASPALFDPDRLRRQILPALVSGTHLRFA